MLTKVADSYDDEVDRAVEAMVSLIEPIMIVFLGGAVGFIVIAMFIPLIKLMQGISLNNITRTCQNIRRRNGEKERIKEE